MKAGKDMNFEYLIPFYCFKRIYCGPNFLDAMLSLHNDIDIRPGNRVHEDGPGGMPTLD